MEGIGVIKMEWTAIPVSSITNAMRGKTVLESHGLDVRMRRSFNTSANNGCGYELLVKGDGRRSRELLKNAGIRVGGGVAKS